MADAAADVTLENSEATIVASKVYVEHYRTRLASSTIGSGGLQMPADRSDIPIAVLKMFVDVLQLAGARADMHARTHELPVVSSDLPAVACRRAGGDS